MVRLAQAVFKGGGVKGIGLVGAMSVAEERGWRWRSVAGTSAGAMIASLVAAGYRAHDVRQILMDLDFRKFRDGSGALRTANLLLHEGMYKGQYVVDLIDRLLTERLGRPTVTFRDLPIACQIVATDLTYRRLLVFPHDLARGPYNHPDPMAFPVAQAVRASIAIPFFFEPYRLALPDGRKVTLVDGGLLSNYPIHLFEPRGRPPLFPTFGFHLAGSDDEEPQRTETPLELMAAMVNTILSGRDRTDRTEMERQEFARSIIIPSGPYRTTQFDLDEDDKQWLYEAGRQGAELFFASPEVQMWLAGFSHRRMHSRC